MTPPRPTEGADSRHTSTGTLLRGLPLILIALALGSASTGCYQRVVKDKSGSYIGQIHEPNLSEGTDSGWLEESSDQSTGTTGD